MQQAGMTRHPGEGLAAAMHRAMHVALTELDRDDGSSRTIAERCRDLPAEIVDAAFADAVGKLLASRLDDPDGMAAVFGVAEAFVYIAGRDRFGRETKSLVAGVLAQDGLLMPKEGVGGSVGLATARAFALGLSVTLGRPLGPDQLREEVLVRDLAPGLWLDLARDQLMQAWFLEAVGESLRRRRLRPADLIVRLPGIVTRQGGATAQSALDIACRVLYADGLYDEAVDLIARANRITKSRFRQAPGHTPSWAQGHETIDDIVARFSHDIRGGAGDTIGVYKDMRMTLDPVLCFCTYGAEEERRERLRSDLVAAVRMSSRIDEYRFITLKEAAKPTGGPSRHWWWTAMNLEVGLQITKHKFKRLSRDMPDIPIIPASQERSDDYDGSCNPLFELLQRADPCGFRR